MASEGRTPLLKKSRWLLLEREENLKEKRRFRLHAYASAPQCTTWTPGAIAAKGVIFVDRQ